LIRKRKKQDNSVSDQTLLIWPATDGAQAWRLTRRNGDINVMQATLDKVLAEGAGVDAVVLPGQLVRSGLTDIPDKLKTAERVSVARFAHEERLSGDPTDLHVVVGNGSPAPTRLVAPPVITDILDRVDPVAIYADFDVINETEGAVKLLDRVVIPGVEGYTVDPDWAEPGFARPNSETLAAMIFARLDQGGAVNLRTGAFRRRRAFATGPWLRVAAAALVCGVMGLALMGAESRATYAQAQSLDEQARALYQSRTGQVAPARLSSLARQVGASNGAGTAFLDLSNVLFSAIDQTPGTQVERLSYNSAEGRLRLRLIYPSFDAAASLEGAVARSGGTLTTGGVREQNGVFIGDAALAMEGQL
jgi:type II secretory pathway component PulL